MIINKKKPYVIAELSANHQNSIKKAKLLVKAAADAGASAIKLQTYKPETMTINSYEKSFLIKEKNNLWKNRNLYSLFKEGSLPWEWHKEIYNYSRDLGITAFSTPFDITAVKLLESLKTPFYKVASFENTDLDLIKCICETNKPIIISSGMSKLSELSETIEFLEKNNCKEYYILKCTSNYPANPKDSNLYTIPHMKKLFKCDVGLSDHTPGIGASIAAIALGAKIIEKHITLDRNDGALDSKFSLEPHEFKNLVTECNRAYQSLGHVRYGPVKNEKHGITRKRSLFFVKDLKKGAVIKKEDLKALRPNLGLPVKYSKILIGMKINRSIKNGTPVNWKYFKN